MHWAEGPLNFLLSKRSLSKPTSVADEKSSMEPQTILHVASIIQSNFGFSFPSSIPENIWRTAFKHLSVNKNEEFTSRGSSNAFTFFFFLYCCCFSPTCPHALACVTCCAWKEHLHTWWHCLSSNEPHNPPSLPPRPFSKQPHPLPPAQPLTAAGVWEQSVPSPPLLTCKQIEVDVIIAEAKAADIL